MCSIDHGALNCYFLTIIRHVAVPPLQHQVDAVAPPADLLHRLAVGHPSGAVAVDLHQLIAHLQTCNHKTEYFPNKITKLGLFLGVFDAYTFSAVTLEAAVF